jgi:hypothetical protein
MNEATQATLSLGAQAVLADILGVGGDPAHPLASSVRAPAPGAGELFELCELLAAAPAERELQTFFQRNVGFLTGLFGTNDNLDLAVLFQPPIGTHHRADFCILQVSQGGALACLVEIESCHERLYTRARIPARRLNGALGQLDDWQSRIDRDPIYHAREFIEAACKLPLLGKVSAEASGVRFRREEEIRNLWYGFGGFEVPTFSYVVVMGRWSQLSADEKMRLIDFNRSNQGHRKIYTYEQLARQANARVEHDDF